MNSFSLDKPKERVFPTCVEKDGDTFPVNGDFRNILKILRMLDDTDILERHKYILAVKWFYTGRVPEDGINLFVEFVAGFNRTETAAEFKEDGENRQAFDFEFDAEEIYASFLMEYRMDLMEVAFLHWYKFKILLRNLSQNSPLKRKIDLRFKDLKGYQGKDLMLMQEAKDSVRLPEKYSLRELEEMREFEDVWNKAGE